MKKVLAFILLSSNALWAQNTPLTFYQPCFGGVDNYHDSAKIDNCDFQDAANVLTDRGFLEKREGSIRIIDQVLAGKPIKYVKEYLTQSNASSLVLHSSQTIYATNFSGSPVAIATVNVNAIVDSVSGFNKHFITTGYDLPFYYDGISTALISTGMPTCKYVEFAHERLWCANSAGAESTLNASAYGDYTDWTIPAVVPMPPDVPNSFTFDRQDGKAITGIFYSPYGIMVFKRNKTFVLRGVDNDDFEKTRISDNIGCVDDGSIQLVNGYVQWMGIEGVYRWAGGAGAPEHISREIDKTIKSVNIPYANSQAITSQNEFANGVFTKNGPSDSWSATIAPGTLVPSSFTRIDDSATEWLEGIITNNISTSITPGSITCASNGATTQLVDDFDGVNGATWTAVGDNYFSVNTNRLRYTGNAVSATGYYSYASTRASVGTHMFELFATASKITGSGVSKFKGSSSEIFFIADSTSVTAVNGFSTKIECAHYNTEISVCTSKLLRYINGAATTLSEKTIQDNIGGEGTTAKFYGFNCAQAISVANGVIIATGTITNYVSLGGSGSSNDFCAHSYSGAGVPTEALGRNTAILVRFSEWYSGSVVSTTLGTIQPSVTNIFTPQNDYKTACTFTSPAFDTGFSTTVGRALYFEETVPVGSTIVYRVADSTASNGVFNWNIVSTTTSGAYKIPLTKEWWKYDITMQTSYSTQTAVVHSITLNAQSTGTWDSAVLYLGPKMNAWGQFNIAPTPSPLSALTVYVRASTSTFSKTATSPAWALQTIGDNLNYSTGTFVQVRLISAIDALTENLQVSAITINYSENSVPRMASLFYDGRYFLSVNTTTAVTSNDLTLVQQRTGKWTFFNGLNYSALTLYNYLPYAGDGTTNSRVWQIMYPNYFYDDNSSSINAYAVTKDFAFEGMNNNKILRQFYLEAYPTYSGVLSLSYAKDKSNTFTTSTHTLTANTMFNEELKTVFPGYIKAQYVKFKFANALANEYMRINSYTVLGEHEKLYRR